jgi:hypothetical protein
VDDPTRSPRHRVLLVRQWDQQVGGSGCCGRFSSATLDSLHAPGCDPWAHARTDMEVMGAAYRVLRGRYPTDEVDVTIADPRNTAWLLPAVWRDARRRGLQPLAALRQVHRATSPRAVVCDGLVLATDVPDAEQAVALVEADLTSRADEGVVR